MAFVSPDKFTVLNIPHHNQHFYNDDLSEADATPGSIRIIALQPGRFTDPLVCGLHTKPALSEPFQECFKAISYSWTDEPGWRSITLNQKPDFRIGKSLFSALRRLRSCDSVQLFWSDQISINQANIAEKNQQVPLMGHIYCRAEATYVWLGPCGYTNRIAGEDEVEHCNAHVQQQNGEINFISKKGPDIVQLCEARVDDKSQWWWRTWIVQELCLPRTIKVIIGAHEFSSMNNAVQALKKSWIDLEPGHVERGMNKRQWQNLPDRKAREDSYVRILSLNTTRNLKRWLGANFYYLLYLTADQDASLAKDKIFGMKSLIDANHCSLDFEVQYQKSDEEVYADITEYFLSQAESLDVIYQHWPRFTSPSWVLDLRNGLRKVPCKISSANPPPPKNQSIQPTNVLKCMASGNTRKTPRREGDYLLVNGIRFATITATVQWNTHDIDVQENQASATIPVADIRDNKIPTRSHAEQEVDPSDRLRTFVLRWLEDFHFIKQEELKERPHQQLAPARVDLTEQFARTITADAYLFRKHNGTKMLGHEFAHHLSAFDAHKQTFEFRTEAFAAWLQEIFFTTGLGVCGTAANPLVQIGDIVVVLEGSSMPIVLRPTGEVDSSHEMKYRFLGECFISGIMYGELMDESGAFPKPDEVFRLV